MSTETTDTTTTTTTTPNDGQDDPSSSASAAEVAAAGESFAFGPFRISSQHVFYATPLSVAFVNLRPIVPGHVLVIPQRVVPLLQDLTIEEYTDLWQTVRLVQQNILTKHYFDTTTTTTPTTTNGTSTTTTTTTPKSSSSSLPQPQPAFNIAIQDGTNAGQSVPHVHVHILPRIAGDYERSDDIYTDLEEWAPRCPPRSNNSSSTSSGSNNNKLEVPDDAERKDRTVEQMAEEAALYRSFL